MRANADSYGRHYQALIAPLIEVYHSITGRW